MKTEAIKNGSEGIFKAAWLIAAVIIISKIAGFIRDVVIANYYGAGLISDAYFYAYQIPALAVVILGGVGGPFHSATVAVFSKIVKCFGEKPEPEVKKLFNTFETFSLIIFAVFSLLCFIFPKQIMSLIINGGSAELVNLAALHLKIMSPMLIIGAVIGIYYGILVTYKHFLLPNLSPMMLSVVITIVLLITKADNTGVILAFSTLLGAAVQLLIQVPVVFKLGYSFKPSFDFFGNRRFDELLELLFPAFLSSTIGQIGVYIDMFFASGLKEGAWTAFGYANRIFQFPVGLLMTAVLVPLFPLFSRLVAKKDTDGIRNYFNRGVLSLVFIAVYIMVVIYLVGEDAIRVALQRGAFTNEATLLVSEILFFITISIIPYAFRDSATRLFYSYNDSKTPFLAACACIILKIILNALLIHPFGINGIALSTSLVTLFNATVLAILLRKKISLGYGHSIEQSLKMLMAGALTFGGGSIFCRAWDSYFPESIIPSIAKIILTTILCGICYILITMFMKIDCIKDIMNRFKHEK